MTIAAKTDRGKVRAVNQDALYAQGNLLVVADGIGGYSGGEIASAMAVELIAQGILAMEGAERLGHGIDGVYQQANAKIASRGLEDERLRNMGTTATMCFIQGNIAYIAHIGDTRAYLWRNGNLQRLTRDHSLVEEMVRNGYITREQAMVHPHRNIITRALGSEGAVRVDQKKIAVQQGDELLLCSDGVTMYMDDPYIAGILRKSASLEQRADILMEQAMAFGGEDNITLILARVEGGQAL